MLADTLRLLAPFTVLHHRTSFSFSEQLCCYSRMSYGAGLIRAAYRNMGRLGVRMTGERAQDICQAIRPNVGQMPLGMCFVGIVLLSTQIAH